MKLSNPWARGSSTPHQSSAAGPLSQSGSRGRPGTGDLNGQSQGGRLSRPTPHTRAPTQMHRLIYQSTQIPSCLPQRLEGFATQTTEGPGENISPHPHKDNDALGHHVQVLWIRKPHRRFYCPVSPPQWGTADETPNPQGSVSLSATYGGRPKRNVATLPSLTFCYASLTFNQQAIAGQVSNKVPPKTEKWHAGVALPPSWNEIRRGMKWDRDPTLTWDDPMGRREGLQIKFHVFWPKRWFCWESDLAGTAHVVSKSRGGGVRAGGINRFMQLGSLRKGGRGSGLSRWCSRGSSSTMTTGFRHSVEIWRG